MVISKCLIILIEFCIIIAVFGQSTQISVLYDVKTQTFTASEGYSPNNYAIATYYTDYNNSGWNYLDITMNSSINTIPDYLIGSKSIGYAEGYATCATIQTFWPNFYSGLFGTDIPGNNTISFLNNNYEWMKENALKYQATDEYWFTIASTIQQIEGLYEGFVDGCTSKSSSKSIQDDTNPWLTLNNPTITHFLMINAWGDLYQITRKLLEPGKDSRLRTNRKIKDQKNELRFIERCSALVKILPNYEDVLFGHGTWDSFESLFPRIIKHYSFPMVHPTSSGSVKIIPYNVYFSSSPALLSSVDDFYIASGYSSLGVMETTNSLYNETILSLIHPNTVLSWVRVVVSNQIAQSGYLWAETFSKYHSGTYTNQWMVLDFSLFKSGSPPLTGFFTVFEEVPGLFHYEDQTNTLTQSTYWPSYNNPYYEDIFDAAGYDVMCDKSKEFCHNTAPRALIFEEYQSQLKSFHDGQWIMEYNNWKADAASEHNSCDTIACRGDLEVLSINQGAFGSLDAKLSSVNLAHQSVPQFYAILGPTHDLQPVFCWSQYPDEAEYSHVGHPDCFNYQWNAFPPTI